MSTTDVIVLGAGGVGSAAFMHLACRGVNVVAIDRFAPPHALGSSHGQTRVTRQAYFEHPDYVPLTLKSYDLWAELEEQVGRKLYVESGLVEIGPDNGIVVPGVLQAAEEHNLEVDFLSARDVERRWPSLRVDESLVAVFEQRAGMLMVEDCVASHLEAAVRHGGRLLADQEVISWQATEDGVTVTTAEEIISAERLVVAAGPWAAGLLNGLGIQFRVLRKSLYWFRTTGPKREDMPVFLYELPEGIFYGFPPLDDRGIKAGEHSGGQHVDDPLAIDRNEDEHDTALVSGFVKQCLPTATQEITDQCVCLYTMTPDEHFIVDRHPHQPNVCFAAGLSGHGFKFTPILGKILAGLALDGETNEEIDFLSLDRFER